MHDTVEKYWRTIIGGLFLISLVFGSLLNAYKFISDFFEQQLPSLQLNPIQIFAAIIGIIGLSLIIWDFLRQRQAKTTIKGVQVRSREDIPLHDLLDGVKKSLTVIAVECNLFWEEQRNRISKMIEEKDIDFKFLLLDPESDLHKLQTHKIIDSNPERIKDSLRKFQEIKNSLSESDKEKLEIRTYNLPPLYTMIVIDENSEDAKIQVEPYIHMAEIRDKIVFIIPKKESKIFNSYRTSYRYILKNSEHYPPQEGG